MRSLHALLSSSALKSKLTHVSYHEKFMSSALIMPYMQGDQRSSQQCGALMHTNLPSIRTRLKQRPGKRKPAAATSVAQLPWMQEWIATGAPLAVTTVCTSKANGRGTELQSMAMSRLPCACILLDSCASLLDMLTFQALSLCS